MRFRPAKKSRQLVAQLLAQLVVEIGERLVEEDEVGVLDQRARDRGPLLLAAGEFGGTALQHRRQAQEFGRLARPAPRSRAAGMPATRSGEAMFSKTVKFG